MKNFREIQIRPPTSEKEREDFDKQEEEKKERSEREFALDVELTGSSLLNILSKQESYSETLFLTPDGEIDKQSYTDINAGRNLLERAKSVNVDRKGLEKLIDGIKKEFRNLSFFLNENGDTLSILVENTIKKDLFVNWVSSGST